MIQDNRPRPFGLPFFDTALLALFLLLRRAHRLVMITHHKSQKRAGLPCVYNTHTHRHWSDALRLNAHSCRAAFWHFPVSSLYKTGKTNL